MLVSNVKFPNASGKERHRINTIIAKRLFLFYANTDYWPCINKTLEKLKLLISCMVTLVHHNKPEKFENTFSVCCVLTFINILLFFLCVFLSYSIGTYLVED